MKVRVVGVLDPRADPLERVYAPFGFVASVERYRSGEGEQLASDVVEADQKRFRGFRLYARSIYDVERLHRVITSYSIHYTKLYDPPGSTSAATSGRSRTPGSTVITSYSIHYTKLYEQRAASR